MINTSYANNILVRVPQLWLLNHSYHIQRRLYKLNHISMQSYTLFSAITLINCGLDIGLFCNAFALHFNSISVPRIWELLLTGGCARYWPERYFKVLGFGVWGLGLRTLGTALGTLGLKIIKGFRDRNAGLWDSGLIDWLCWVCNLWHGVS